MQCIQTIFAHRGAVSKSQFWRLTGSQFCADRSVSEPIRPSFPIHGWRHGSGAAAVMPDRPAGKPGFIAGWRHEPPVHDAIISTHQIRPKGQRMEADGAV